MSGWMLYVYKNFERPDNVVGVPITVGVVTPDGYDELYTVSDETGNFAVAYTPSAAGEYTIYAFFDGTDSYYGDWAQRSMVVAESPARSNLLTYGLYVIGIIIILAVLLVGLWIKRK